MQDIEGAAFGSPGLECWTDKQCRAAKPGEDKSKLFDGYGIYLEVLKTGVRSWRWKYRIDGKEKRLTFGRYPDISLKEDVFPVIGTLPITEVTSPQAVSLLRKRYQAVQTIEAARAMLKVIEARPAYPPTRLASQLLALTAVRSSGLRLAEVGEFEDLDGDDRSGRCPRL